MLCFPLVILIEQAEFSKPLHFCYNNNNNNNICMAHLTACKALSHLQSHLIVTINILDKHLPFQKMTLRLKISLLRTGRN
jgi:hypothetical protein